MKERLARRAKWLFATSRRSVTGVVGLSVLLIILALAVGSNDSTQRTASQPTPTTNFETDESTTTAPLSAKNTLLPGASAGLRLVTAASTDFAGNSIDPNVWHLYDSVGNQGVGFRRPSAITQSDGELKITARGDVSGGMAQAHGQLYGRWVVRAKMDKGAGYGPAILLWPDSEKWPEDGEIDFVEIPDGNRTQAVMSVHYGKDNRQLSQTVFGNFADWHTFAVDWFPDRIIFYIDGVERYRVRDKAAIPHTPMHLAIQNDVGACDSWIGCTDSSTPEEVALHVSNVRVYDYTGGD